MPAKKGTYTLVMFFLICILLIELSGRTYGQAYTIKDTATVQNLLTSSADSANTNPEKSSRYAQNAIDISTQINYKFGIAAGLKSKGQAETYLGKDDEAIQLLNQAQKMSNDNHFDNLVADIEGCLASAYVQKGDFSNAIQHFDIALKRYLNPSNDKGLARTYFELGSLMVRMHNYDKAIEYQLKAADILARLHKPLRTGMLYINISATYISIGKYPEARHYLYMAAHISDSMHTKQNLPVIYMNLGLCHDQAGKKDSALFYYFKSLNLFKEMQDVPNEIILLANIGSCYYSMNQLKDAEKYEKESLALAKQSSDLQSISMNNYNLSDLYYQKGDYLNAFRYRDSALANRDSLYNQGRTQALAELTTKYETKEIEHKNSLLKHENDLQKLRLQRKDIFIFSGFGAAILFLVIGWQLVRQNRLKANQQKLELEQKQLLAQINPHFIFNCLNSIQQFVVQNDTLNANKYLADFALLMRQTLDNSKDGTISLRREIDYLENYLSFEDMRFEDKFTYTVYCEPDINADATEIPSMIIQPFVENAIRHGLCNLETRKGLLHIRFYKKDGFLYCEVDDNGIGMEEAQKLKEQTFIKYQSHGMELTRQRLALVSKMQSEDYKITIVNKKGQNQNAEGTTIIIKFPLEV